MSQDTRFGIVIDGVNPNPIEVVDVTAMLTKDEYITVHGGWFRNALKQEGFENKQDGWEVTLVDVVVTDPSDEYRVVGVKGNVISNGIPKGHEKRPMLSKSPSSEEAAVSEDMKKGKKPQSNTERRLVGSLRRELSGIHKKILVHGYCSASNPYPTSHFTDAVAFSWPGTPTSWPHDTFARNIRDFGNAQGLHGCACIAHSQGGAACLHLYSYYWSCLDNASMGGSRLIQSVGTPYQGTCLLHEAKHKNE
jgi:hypothetical protein